MSCLSAFDRGGGPAFRRPFGGIAGRKDLEIHQRDDKARLSGRHSGAVLDFFRGGDGETNFPFFSSETVIQTDVDFIDYCSTKRIENAEEELGNALEETFSVRPEVTLLWEYAGSITEGDGEEGYLSLYVGREIKITKVLLRDVGGSIGEEVKREMTEHIAEEYGCDAEFV